MSRDSEMAIADLRQRELDARTELRRQVLTGAPTGATRARMAELSRRLKAEIARDGSAAEVRAQTKRSIRDNGRRQRIAKFGNAVRAAIGERMAPLALPAPIEELK